MQIFTFKTLLIIYFLYNSPAAAQYDEYFRTTDIRAMIVYGYALQPVIETDGYLLKVTGVKDVTVTDDSGNLVSKISFNTDGWITNFSSWEYNNGEEINYDIHWNNYETPVTYYSEKGTGGINIKYTSFFKDYLIDRITADFGNGLSEDYIMSYRKLLFPKQIENISFRDNSKDTIYMEQVFNYDSKNYLINVKETKYETTLDSVYYAGNIIGIITSHFKKRIFEIKDNRIVKETTIYPSKQLNAKVYSYETEIPDVEIIKKYFYRTDGMIDYIEREPGGGKIIYTYTFY